MNQHKFEIEFIDSIMKYSDIPCINLESIKEHIFSQNSGKFKRELEHGNYKIIINVRWNKEKFVFKCSKI